MRPRCLIIGSNCFSGAAFASHVIVHGFDVLGISRSPEPHACFLPYKRESAERFRFVQADLNSDLERIMVLVEEWRPKFVANFAAQGMVAQSWNNPEQWFLTNTQSMVALQDRLRRCEFLDGYLQVSTPEVYGSTASAISEDTVYSPSTPYAASKAACDLSLLAFIKGYGFPAVMTRSTNVCGPGQQLYRIIPKMVLSVLLGKKLRLEGGGAAQRSFIHIRDVVDAQLRSLIHGQPGDVFHLATDQVVTIRELVEYICTLLGARFEDHVEIVEGRRGQDGAYVLDCRKAHTDLGWQPRYTLEDVLRETIDWVKENLDVLRNLSLDYVHKR